MSFIFFGSIHSFRSDNTRIHCSLFKGAGDIDLSKEFLIDVWDWDPPPFGHDFIGYLVASLGKLLQHAESGNPLPLNPPPPPHKQDVGCIYVETAFLGLPQVTPQFVLSIISRNQLAQTEATEA